MSVLISRNLINTNAISNSAKNLYERLLVKAYDDINAFPSIANMSKEFGISESVVKRLLKELRTYGLIRIYKGMYPATNNYIIIPCAWVDFETTYTDSEIYIHTEEEFEEMKDKVRSYIEAEVDGIGLTDTVETPKPKKKRNIKTLEVRLEEVNRKCEKEGYKLNGADCAVLFAVAMKERGLKSTISSAKNNSLLKATFADIDNNTTRHLISVFVKHYEEIVPKNKDYNVPTIAGLCQGWIFSKLVQYCARLESAKTYDVVNHSNRVVITEDDIVF